jgi:hypothetical protein
LNYWSFQFKKNKISLLQEADLKVLKSKKYFSKAIEENISSPWTHCYLKELKRALGQIQIMKIN